MGQKVHLLTISIVDQELMDGKETAWELMHTRFANHCMSPDVHHVVTYDVGEWSDDHPVNKTATDVLEYVTKYGQLVDSIAYFDEGQRLKTPKNTMERIQESELKMLQTLAGGFCPSFPAKEEKEVSYPEYPTVRLQLEDATAQHGHNVRFSQAFPEGWDLEASFSFTRKEGYERTSVETVTCLAQDFQEHERGRGSSFFGCWLYADEQQRTEHGRSFRENDDSQGGVPDYYIRSHRTYEVQVSKALAARVQAVGTFNMTDAERIQKVDYWDLRVASENA